MTSRPASGAIAAVALAVTLALSACSGDDTGDQPPATAPGGSIAPPSIPDDTIGRDAAPPLDTTATGDTFLGTITGDSIVTADELEAAYRSYIDCLTAVGVHGVYAWDVSLDVGPVLDGLSITGDDPTGARLRSAQAGVCTRPSRRRPPRCTTRRTRRTRPTCSPVNGRACGRVSKRSAQRWRRAFPTTSRSTPRSTVSPSRRFSSTPR